MRITLFTLTAAAFLLSASCMDGVSSTQKQIQSCYDTGAGYVCVDTPDGARMQPRDVNGDLIKDIFICADEDSDSNDTSMSTSDSDLDSDSTGSEESTESESDADDSDSDEVCGGNSDSDGDGDGVPNGDDCDCIGNPGDGGGEPTPV